VVARCCRGKHWQTGPLGWRGARPCVAAAASAASSALTSRRGRTASATGKPSYARRARSTMKRRSTSAGLPGKRSFPEQEERVSRRLSRSPQKRAVGVLAAPLSGIWCDREIAQLFTSSASSSTRAPPSTRNSSPTTTARTASGPPDLWISARRPQNQAPAAAGPARRQDAWCRPAVGPRLLGQDSPRSEGRVLSRGDRTSAAAGAPLLVGSAAGSAGTRSPSSS